MNNPANWKSDPATVDALFSMFLNLFPAVTADMRQVANARAILLAVFAGVPGDAQGALAFDRASLDAAVHPLDRLEAGQATADDLACLGAAYSGFKLAAGAVPLERCMRVERTRPKHERAQRDQWLRRALWVLVPDAKSRTELFAMLLQHWNRFLAGPLWRAWRDDEQPPEGVAELHMALFHASRLNKGAALTSERQLRNLFGSEFESQFP